MDARPNNYRRLCREWQQRFLTLDPAELCRRLPGLEDCGRELRIRHLGETYLIGKETGELRRPEGGSISHTVQLNIYTLFGFVQSGAALTGDWLPYASLRGAGPFGPAFQKGVLQPLARTFSGRLPLLCAALEALEGTRLPLGDVGYEVPAFRCIPVRVLFWDADEEFPAQANLLFDRSAVDFIHVESVVSIAMALNTRLAALAGLPLDRSAIDLT